MNQIIEYIQRITGLEADLHPADNVFLEKLPLYIRRGFHFYEGKLAGRDLLFMFPESKNLPTPKQLQTQVAKMEELFGRNAVVVFEEVQSYMRNQLAHNRTAFIVTDEQMYIPYMFISLDERKQKKLTHLEHFYPATQTLLIYHLWKKPLDGLNLKEVAAHFDYAAMTITRAVRELEAAGICTTRGGREKVLEFVGTNREIWEQAKPFMKNPVKKEIKGLITAGNGMWIPAGMDALATYSNLAQGYEKTYAVEKKYFKQHDALNVTEYGDITVQLWNYDPSILEKNGVADPFSVYLTLNDHADERVQIALEDMMEGIL